MCYIIIMKKIFVLFIILSFAAVFTACSQENPNIEIPVESETEMSEEAQKTVRIAVIDTGFSPEAIPSESIFPGKNYYYPELSTEDTYGHGTAVASIILQYSPEAVLVPLVSNVFEDNKIRQVHNKVFAQMITDAVDIYDCDIINISAGLILDKKEVRDACIYAEENGVLIVASVGNDYDINGKVMYYPAGYETVLAVGALNKDGSEIAYFSQRGEWVDVFAVGEDVTIGTLSGNTRTSSGSSYSAAKVAAIAANVFRRNPEISLEELKIKTIEEAKKQETFYE